MTSPPASPAVPPYELYQAEWCPYSTRVRQRLTELGIDFIARQVPADEEDRDALFERTGQRSIPALIAGETVLVEPREIHRYLNRTHQETPESAKHREEARRHEQARQPEHAAHAA